MTRLDPVSGTVYYLLLGVFAVMPLLVGTDRPSGSRPAVAAVTGKATASRRAVVGYDPDPGGRSARDRA